MASQPLISADETTVASQRSSITINSRLGAGSSNNSQWTFPAPQANLGALWLQPGNLGINGSNSPAPWGDSWKQSFGPPHVTLPSMASSFSAVSQRRTNGTDYQSQVLRLCREIWPNYIPPGMSKLRTRLRCMSLEFV